MTDNCYNLTQTQLVMLKPAITLTREESFRKPSCCSTTERDSTPTFVAHDNTLGTEKEPILCDFQSK